MLIIFDLDGTLIDSTKDLEISVNSTREHFGCPPLEAALIHSYVGNGAAVLIRHAMGPQASEEVVEEAHRYFLKFYRRHALENTRLYPGIAESLSELAKASHALAVLTNKPAKISFDILTALGIQECFFRVFGGDSLKAKKPDPVGILRLIEESRTSKQETVMVGDSSVDVLTARNAGVCVCGVAWGIQPESFEKHPPDFMIHETAQLVDIGSRAPAY